MIQFFFRFPQLAYIISDILVYVDVHPMHDRKYLTRVKEFARKSNEKNASTDKPALILIQNKAEDTTGGTLSIKRTTTQFFQCAKEDIELDGFLQVRICLCELRFI
jgi:hypothetical protein